MILTKLAWILYVTVTTWTLKIPQIHRGLWRQSPPSEDGHQQYIRVLFDLADQKRMNAEFYQGSHGRSGCGESGELQMEKESMRGGWGMNGRVVGKKSWWWEE